MFPVFKNVKVGPSLNERTKDNIYSDVSIICTAVGQILEQINPSFFYSHNINTMFRHFFLLSLASISSMLGASSFPTLE